MLRLAFIGIDHPHGAHWRQTLENFSETIQITAIVPRFGGALTSLEERFAEVRRFETFDEAIARGDFEAALVCLPNDEGPTALLRLAEAGKHILSEKPCAATAADVRALVAAVRKSGVAFQNGFMWRYDACALRLRTMLAEERFGKLIHIDMRYVTSDIRRRGPEHYLFDKKISGGGFLNWLGCHHLDLLPYITGRRITGVTARLGNFGATATGIEGNGIEDGGTVIFDLEGGALATFTGGYWFPRWAGETTWSIRGGERWVDWKMAHPNTSGRLEIHGPQPQWHAMEETFQVAADATPGYGGVRGVDVVGDWLAAINEGRGSKARDCRNTPESTLATLELLDAAYESSRSGKRVECNIGN